MKKYIALVVMIVMTSNVQSSDPILTQEMLRWVKDVLLPRKIDNSLSVLRKSAPDRVEALLQSYQNRRLEIITFVQRVKLEVNNLHYHNPDEDIDFVVRRDKQNMVLDATLALGYNWTGSDGRGDFYYLLRPSNFETCPNVNFYQELIKAIERGIIVTYSNRLKA